MADKKKKGGKVVMSLNAFLADEATGSWADETMDLPTQPMAVASGSAANQGTGGGYRSMGAPTKPLPTEPPYLAYIGNLGFEAKEADLEEMFHNLQISKINFVKDRATGQFKGFGYVEFESLADLENALKMNGERMQGRAIKVDVAEPPRSGTGSGSGGFGGGRDRGDRGPERDIPKGSWRRDVPMAPQNVQAPPPVRSMVDRPPRSFDEPRTSGGPAGDRAPLSWKRAVAVPAGEPTRAPAAARVEPKAAAPLPPRKPSVNPFGAAKPTAVDQAEVLRRVEEKLAAKKQAIAEELAKETPPPTSSLEERENQRPARAGAPPPRREYSGAFSSASRGGSFTSSARPAADAGPKKPRSNPFGSAKPVDQKSVLEKVEMKVEEKKAELKKAVEQVEKEEEKKAPAGKPFVKKQPSADSAAAVAEKSAPIAAKKTVAEAAPAATKTVEPPKKQSAKEPPSNPWVKAGKPAAATVVQK